MPEQQYAKTREPLSEKDARRLAEAAAVKQTRQEKQQSTAERLAEIDELLDDIELVLEENEFVAEYTQQGGE